ncbi:hypothetical protein Tco_1136416 [Tanacetum coccineum]
MVHTRTPGSTRKELRNGMTMLRGDKDFKVGDLVLLFNSRFEMHPGPWKQRNINEYWWRIYKSGDLEVLES